jgi:hypothetical protein
VPQPTPTTIAKLRTPVRLQKHRTGNNKTPWPRTPNNGHHGNALHQSLGQVSALGSLGTLSRHWMGMEAPGVNLTANSAEETILSQIARKQEIYGSGTIYSMIRSGGPF